MKGILFTLLTIFNIGFSNLLAQDLLSLSNDNCKVPLLIVSYDSSWRYEIDIQNKVLRLSETLGRFKDARWPEAAPIIDHRLSENRKSRIQLGKQAIIDLHISDIKWAEYSPDRKRVAIGYQNPIIDPISSTSVFETSSRKLLGKFEVEEDMWIEDIFWCPDSRYICVLESEEHYSKSFGDLFKFISGHPVPLITFRVEILDLELNSKTKLSVAKDIRYGEGVFTTPRDRK